MKILVVEDEERIASAIQRVLESQLFKVDLASQGSEGLYRAMNNHYDLVILDRMLPGRLDGADIAATLREVDNHVPILMLTAKTRIEDRVAGLNSGADDYLTKPFSMEELIARVRALARRPAVRHPDVMIIDDLSLNTVTGEVRRGGVQINLSNTEFKLLRYLVYHSGQIVSKDDILAHVWSENALVGPNTVEVSIRRLRGKVDKPFADKARLLQTVHGFGYKLGTDSHV